VTTSTAVAWHRGQMIGFDTETTGVDVDVEQDRIVTGSVVHIVPTKDGPQTATMSLLADPGVPIPEAASAIHGITTERAQADGRPPSVVLSELTTYLADAIDDGCPIVGMNLVYDLTILDRDCRRHGVTPLSQRVPAIRPVIDVRVLDKRVDPYRRGGRKLTDLCLHYGVRIDGAHDATFDALAALRVAWRIAEKHPQLQIDLGHLHDQQVVWAAEQVANFAAYRRRQGEPLEDEDGTWPIKPWRAEEHAAAEGGQS